MIKLRMPESINVFTTYVALVLPIIIVAVFLEMDMIFYFSIEIL